MQKDDEGLRGLTEGSWWPELLRRVDVSDDERRVGAELADEGRRRGLRVSGRRGSTCGAPARPVEGSAGVRMVRGSPAARNFGGAPSYLRRRYGENPARPWTEVGDGGLWVVAGPETEPVHCLAGLRCGGEARSRRRGALLRVEVGRSG